MNFSANSLSSTTEDKKLSYRLLKFFVLYGLYGAIPLFVIWTRTPTIELEKNYWFQTTFLFSLCIFAVSFVLTLRKNSIAHTNALLGLGRKTDQPSYKGWKLAVVGSFFYASIGLMSGLGYAMTADLVLRMLPFPSPAVISATLVYTHRGSGSRSDSCQLKNTFRTDYGEKAVCINSVMKNIAMPNDLRVGESVLLEGESNGRVFTISSVVRAN